jgi:hypothetical protein
MSEEKAGRGPPKAERIENRESKIKKLGEINSQLFSLAVVKDLSMSVSGWFERRGFGTRRRSYYSDGVGAKEIAA